MSNIARLGVVVEQSGIETTLKGLDAIAAKMKAIETSKVSPVSTPKGGSTATSSLAKEEFKLTAFKEKEAEKRLTVAEKSAAKEKDIALKTNSAKEIIESRTAAYRKVLADKAESEAIKHNQQMAFIHKRSQDGILRIEEKTKADILKIREKADSDLIKQSSKLNNDLVRMSTAQSLRIAEQEAKNTSNLSAISRKELEKRITEQTRATTRIETEKAKSATRIEQIEAANQAKIQQIRERTAAYAEKLQMREELAARRSIEQQGKAYSSLADIANKARNVMAVSFAGYGITEAVGAVIKTADAMMELNARLRLVTQSSAELKQVQMELFRVSQSSGTSLKENGEIYFGIARATKTLGTSLKDLIFLTEGLGKAAIVSGASTQSFKAAMFQLRQALESGVLRGQEFNSISEQAPRVLQAIGEGLGKTTGELRKMAGQGQLTTDVVMPALMKGLQSVNKEFDSLPTTVSRATTMVENSFSMLVARANEASKGTSTLAGVIKNISTAMDSISTDSITTAMNAAGYAVNGLALVLSGKLIQALGAAAVAKVASTKADMAMVRSNATVAASELQKAQAASVAAAEKVRAAAMGVEAANAAVAAAERVVLAEEASRMSMLKTLAAREALTVAQAKAAAAAQASVAATTAMTASNNAAATAADVHAAAQARLAAAGTTTSRVMTGLRSVFTAMGGWVTVAIGVIWGLVTVWDNVANAAENAARKQKEAVMRAKQSDNIAGIIKEENITAKQISEKAELKSHREEYARRRIAAGVSPDSPEMQQHKKVIDSLSKEIRELTIVQTKQAQERQQRTAALQSTIANSIQDENAGYEKIVKNYQDSVKFKSDKQRQMDDLKEIDKQADDALSKLYKRPSVEDVRLGLYNSDKVAKAAAEIERIRSEQRKLVMEKYAKKEGGAKKPKAPELSAGYEAALSYTQEQLEVINKMTSAQEKLLGYIKPELLERKQSLEAEKERENTVAKIAKIQEQLNKKNLGKGVAGQLQEQLKIYQQQKDAISQELVVTQALQREQNNLKIYEMDVLRIAQQKNELQKAYLDAAVATGSLSGQEAKQQEQLNALKMIEIEYAGKIIEAQKTYDLMVKNRYTEEAEASKLRLDSLISERDTKLEVAKIKMYSDQEARTFEAGWRRAWGTYKDEASNASSFGEKVMGDALKGIEDAFYAMMSGTKYSFKDLWKSILSDMNRYFAKQLTSTIADAIIGGFRTPQDAGFSVNVSGGQGQSVTQQVIGASSKGFDVLDIFSNSKSSYDATINKALTSSIGQSLGFSQTPISSATTSMFVEGSQSIYGFTDATAATGAELTSLGQAASTAGQALGYLPAVMQAAEGRYISAVGSAVGQYFGGPIGSMAGAAIGGLLDDAFGFGEKKPDERKARFGYGASDALREEGLRTGWTGSSAFGQFRTYDDKWFSGSEMGAAMGQFIDSLESLDNTVADSLKLTSDQTQSAIEALKAIDKEYSFGLQWGDFTANSKAREQIAVDRYATILDSIDAGWGDFVRQFQGSFDQFPTYLQGVIAAMSLFREESSDLVDVFGKQIDGISAFAEFAKAGENNADAFKRLYSVFQATNAVLESLGKSAKGTGLETTALRESFIKLAGGMESLAGYVQEYYDGFYTEAEKEAKVREQLQREFDKYNATLPTTRLEWRKLMESLDLSTQAGQEAAAKLYQLQGAFLSITPEIEETKDVVDAAADAIERMKDKAKDLEDYFTNYLSGADYSGMTEQGREAASALDELVVKMGELADAGGNTQLALDALNRYMSREIPRLYDSITKPFRDMLQQQGRTDVGKQIYDIFGQVVSATKAINEVARAQTTAISKSLSAQLKSIDKLAETTNFVEQTFGGIVTDASGNATVIGESGATLGVQFGGDVSTNANLAEEVVSKYDATFGDIRKWFDEKSVFEQSAGKEALTEVFNQAQQTTAEQLSNIYEKATGKEAESLGKVVDQYAQDVNLSNKDLSDTIKDSILSTDLLSKADPTNELTKMAFGREATAEERQAVTDAYNWGVNNGKALSDIVTDIVSHVSRLEEAQTHLGAAALEAAKDVGDFDKALENSTKVNKDLSNYSTYDSAGSLIQEGNAEQVPLISEAEAAALREQAEQDARDAAQKALEAKIKALEEVTAGFVAGVDATLRDSFAGIIAQSKVIGMSDIAQQAVAAKNTMDDVFGSVVESVAATVAGLNALGVTSATDAAKELMDKFEQGAIKTADELKSAVDAVFESVNTIEGTTAIKQTLKDASDAAKAIFDDTAKQLREQLVAPWQSAYESLASNSIGAEINAAIKAKDQALADAKTLAESLGESFDDLAKEIQRGFDAQTQQLREQIVSPWRSAYESLASNSIGAEISAAIKAKDQALADAKTLAESLGESFDDLAKEIQRGFDAQTQQLREQIVSPWQSAFDALTGNRIDAEINAAIKAKDQALADAKTLAESLGQNFDDLAKEIQRGFDAQLFGLTKQKLQGVIDSISKITDFQAGIDDAIFGLRVGMSGADVSGLYAQRQADIKAQLDAAMLGDNLDEQIGLANKLRETITQRYAAEQQAQERMMSFARGLDDYLRRLRTSDKSTGSIYDRLTEAQKQFAEDVALSRGTGAEAEAARGRITNTSDTLLDLARQFYANGEGYQQIYNSVVGGLEGLQIDTRTEAERQLDAINEGNDHALKQIAELQALKGTFDMKMSGLVAKQSEQVSVMQGLATQLGLSQSQILQALKDLPNSLAAMIAKSAPAQSAPAQAAPAQAAPAQAAPTVQTFDQSKAVSDAFSVAPPSSYVDSNGYSTIKTPTGGSVGFYDPSTGVSASPKLPELPAPSSPRIVAQQTAFDKAVQSYRETGRIAGGQATFQAAVAESGMGQLATLQAIKDAAKIDGSHKDGLSHVPFDGYVAELHKGEMVLDANTSDALRKYGVNVKYSQDQMKAMMQPANDDASKQQLIQEVKRLNASLEKLRQEVALQGQSDRQQRGEIASRQEGMQKQQIVSTMRLTASNI